MTKAPAPVADVTAVVAVTLNGGAVPCTTESARLASPSCAKALLRIASIRPVRAWREATVKLHAS